MADNAEMNVADALVLTGTADARELVALLASRGLRLLVSTAGAHAATPYHALPVSVRHGRLEREGLRAVLVQGQMQALIDATHPFAEEAHRESQAAAEQAGIPYVRYERRPLDSMVPEVLASPLLHVVNDDVEAAGLAAVLGGVVFLTTGTKRLACYAQRFRSGKRLVVRLLPTVENLTRCAALGIDQANIVALQGPFDESLNRALYEKFGVQVVVTKESGVEGGLPAKIRPALERQAHVILIRRPTRPGVLQFHDREELAAHVQQLVRRKDTEPGPAG